MIRLERYRPRMRATRLVTRHVRHGSNAVTQGGDSLTRYITAQLAVHGDLNDPNSYIGHTSIRPSRANFALSHADITSVIFNPKKKWGMGPYPHDGRVIVETSTRRREFIILGKQSGREIAERLFADVRSFKPEPLSGST